MFLSFGQLWSATYTSR